MAQAAPMGNDPTKKLTGRKLRAIRHDPERTARVIDLHYVRDTRPGIERLRHGAHFRYTYKGRPVKDKQTLERIRALAIPPAWNEVWICADPKGHLQATGKDARGRKQYRYHPDWSLVRSRTKFHSTLEFGELLPRIRQRLERDLRKKELTREKVLATVVSIMDQTHVRVGNPAYEKENRSYGLSTLKDRHVKDEAGRVRLVFKGKTGIMHDIKIKSRRLAGLIMKCRDLPGQELFQYIDSDGVVRPIDSGMVNDYIREICGGEFTSKDFRTWKGTVHCLSALIANTCPDGAKARKEAMNKALDETARHLGNTRAVCRKYYVHPEVITAYECQRLHKLMGDAAAVVDKDVTGGHTFEERLVLKVLSAARRRPTEA